MIKAEDVAQWITDQGGNFYRIYAGSTIKDGQNPACSYWSNNKDDAYSQQEMLARLERDMARLSAGQYSIRIKEAPNNQKGDLQETFLVVGGVDSAAADKRKADESAIGAAIYDRVQKAREDERANMKDEIAAAVKAAMAERDMDELKRRNQRLEEQLAALTKERHDYSRDKLALINNGITGVKDIIAGIFQAKAGKPQPSHIAAIDGANDGGADEMEVTEEEEKRFTDAVSALREIEPDAWLDILEGIVAIAKTDPATYQTARAFILKRHQS